MRNILLNSIELSVGNMLGVMNGLSMRYLSGTTNTASAISTMRNNMFNSGNGDRVDNNNVGVVITDGRYLPNEIK